MPFVTDLTPLSTGATSVYLYSKALHEAFACFDKFKEPYNLAVQRGSYLEVPRLCVPMGKSDDRTTRPLGAINCKFPARDSDQQRCIDEAVPLLKAGKNFVMEAPTGWGKSYVGSAVAAQIGEATLIVVTKQDLMDSWYDTLVKLIGVDPKDIGKIQGAASMKNGWQGKRFVIGMVQTLMKDADYENDVCSYFGLLICDETHRMAADCFSRVCQKFRAKLRMGLSATPKRNDGRDNLLRGHLGPVMVRGLLVPMIPKVLVKQTGWKKPERMPMVPGRMMNVLKIMAGSYARNMIIVDFSLKAYEKHRTTLLLSDLTEHLVRLHQLLVPHIDPKDIGYYVGGLNKVQRSLAGASASS